MEQRLNKTHFAQPPLGAIKIHKKSEKHLRFYDKIWYDKINCTNEG